MVGLNLQNLKQLLAYGCNAFSDCIAVTSVVYLLTIGVCLSVLPVSIHAQSSSSAVRPSVNRPGKIPERSRRPALAPVRQASIEVFDSFAPESYDTTLAPAAMDYETIDMNSSAGGCNDCGAATDACCCQPFGWLLDWSRGDLWIGTTGFTGASNFLGATAGSGGQIAGNFGFQEGFNFGTRLPGVLGGQLGSQLGMRFTQTQLDGTTAGDDSRTQTFVTAGLFRRVDYGLQGGLVVDYLHDDWVYKADLLQLRGELSFLFSACHDFGFRFSDSQQTDDTQATLRGGTAPLDIRLAALNTYRFFYRARFGQSLAGVAELQAGFSEDSGAILGANLRAPLQNQLGLDVNATYLLPADDIIPSYTREGWNLSMSLVWTPGRCFGGDRDYYRPLMNVGDNGSFLTRHAAE